MSRPYPVNNDIFSTIIKSINNNNDTKNWNPQEKKALAINLYSQGALESGNFSSNIFKKYNNGYGQDFAQLYEKFGATPEKVNGRTIASFPNFEKSTDNQIDYYLRHYGRDKITNPNIFSKTITDSTYIGKGNNKEHNDNLKNYQILGEIQNGVNNYLNVNNDLVKNLNGNVNPPISNNNDINQFQYQINNLNPYNQNNGQNSVAGVPLSQQQQTALNYQQQPIAKMNPMIKMANGGLPPIISNNSPYYDYFQQAINNGNNTNDGFYGINNLPQVIVTSNRKPNNPQTNQPQTNQQQTNQQQDQWATTLNGINFNPINIPLKYQNIPQPQKPNDNYPYDLSVQQPQVGTQQQNNNTNNPITNNPINNTKQNNKINWNDAINNTVPYLSNIANAFRKYPNIPTPITTNPISLQQQNFDADRYNINRANRTANLQALRGADGSTQSALIGYNNANMSDRLNAVNQQDRNINNQIANQQNMYNNKVQQYNNSLLNNYNNANLFRTNAQQQNSLRNLADISQKYINQQNVKQVNDANSLGLQTYAQANQNPQAALNAYYEIMNTNPNLAEKQAKMFGFNDAKEYYSYLKANSNYSSNNNNAYGGVLKGNHIRKNINFINSIGSMQNILNDKKGNIGGNIPNLPIGKNQPKMQNGGVLNSIKNLYDIKDKNKTIGKQKENISYNNHNSKFSTGGLLKIF